MRRATAGRPGIVHRIGVIVGTAALILSTGCSSGSESEPGNESATAMTDPDSSASADDFTDAGSSSVEGESDGDGEAAGESEAAAQSDDASGPDPTSEDEADFTESADPDDGDGTRNGDGIGETGAGDDGEIEQVPADEVETVGTPPPTFVYTEEVEPAESVAATLCNLNAPFLRSLRAVDASGDPVTDDDLRLSVLSLSDSVSLWEDLKISFPDASDDIDTAREIEELWSAAIAADEAGETGTAASLMLDADEQIDQLPDVGPDDIDSCES